MTDVARRAKVSPGLVSRVLNDDPTLRLREETRAAVLRAIAELGYVPNATARALRKERVGAIGLVLTDVTSPMFTDIVGGAQKAATAAGYVVMLIDADEVEARSELFAELVSSSRVDGLLLQGGYGAGADRLLRFAAELPSVVLNSDGVPGAASVQVADAEATRIATRHLLDLGHERLGFVAGPEGSTTKRRQDAFATELRAAGVPRGTVIRSGWSPRQAYDAVAAHLAEHRCPTGLVVVNAGVAVGVLSALGDAGHEPPHDVSVIAVHDTWFAPHLRPALTTVWLPLRDLGRIGVERLVSALDGAIVDDVVVDDPAPELMVRSSTGPPPHGGRVSRAAR